MWANNFTKSTIDLIQQERLNQFIRCSVSRSPIYAPMVKHYLKGNMANTHTLHVTKAELMARFDEWVIDKNVSLTKVEQFLANPKCIGKPFLNQYYLWESSGSSGVPGVFVQDSRAIGVYDALEWGRLNPNDFIRLRINPFGVNKRIALIGVLNGHFASVVSFIRCTNLTRMGNSAMRQFSIALPIADLMMQLNAFQPDIIATYPSMAAVLAEQQLSGELQITPSDIFLGGEMLGLESRSEIQNVFSCCVHNQYGASEFLPIAWECAFGHLHVNSDWVILEPVDHNYQPVEDEQMSFTTLISNLANYVQPIYRYDIGDQVIMPKKQCACGSPFPQIELIGRKDDVIYMKNSVGKGVTILPLTLTTLIEQCGIYAFQLRQSHGCQLKLILAGSHHYSVAQQNECRRQLEAYLIHLGLTNVSLVITAVQSLKVGRSGKIQRIFNEKESE